MNSRSDIQIDINQVRIDILKGIKESRDRGLTQTTRWLSELNFALKDQKIVYKEPLEEYDDGISPDEKDAYMLAISYFDNIEYDRAAHFLENTTSPKCVFLQKYSQYMSSEKKRVDNSIDVGVDKMESTQVLLDLLSFFKVCMNKMN